MTEMTSNRPYLIRALYEWIGDNGLTPYLMVDAAAPGVRVPPQTVKDGRVVLNIAARAVNRLELANDSISFQARFSGVPMLVIVPVEAVLAVYAMENGQGMLFPAEVAAESDEETPDEGADSPGLALAERGPAPAADGDDPPPPPPRPARGPHLRVIK